MTRPLVFITGATGFIGSHTVRSTLKSGYRVRLSIRRADQESILRERYIDYKDSLDFVILPDLSDPAFFKAVLQDVDYIFHLASPMPGRGVDIHHDYVNPAVDATLSILRAAQSFPKIKKVIIMSSALALAPIDAVITKKLLIQENTGEQVKVDLSMDFPDGFAGHGLKYAASKIKAHEAMREFLKTNSLHFTVASFHPTFVLGDSMVQTSAEDVGGMNALFWSSMGMEKPHIANAWVHVRDVADAHVKALNADFQSGTEFILTCPALSWDEAISYITENYPQVDVKLQGPFEEATPIQTPAADQILNMRWRSAHSIIDDVVKQQLAFRPGRS